jgi:RHS repeat-associated protein
MPDSIDEFDQSELSIESRGSGEIQIDTGPPDDLWAKLQAQVNAGIRFREHIKGLTDKAEREAKEKARRDAKPAPPKVALPPNTTVVESPPNESVPVTGDSPPAQGAPDLAPPTKDITLKPQSGTARPLVNRDEPSHAVADQLNPIAPSDIAELISPPPATPAELLAFLRRLERGENEPQEPHPTLAGPAAQRPAAAADPVDLFSGAFTAAAVDLTVPTAFLPIAMSRSYRSGRSYFGPFGYGWDHVYNVYLRVLKDGRVALWTGQLREQHFINTGGGFEPDAGYCARLERMPGFGDNYSLTFAGGTQWLFERPLGWSHPERIPLASIRDRHGNLATLTYGSLDQLISVLDDAGRGLRFKYGSCELLERVTDHTGAREVRYEHDPEVEHLVRVVLPASAHYPAGLATSYEYDSYAEHPAMRHNILRILDAERRLIVENEFAGPSGGWEFNSVVRQRMAGFDYQFEYEQIQYVAPDPANVDALCTRTSVRPPDGSLHTYTFNYRGDLLDHRFRLNRDGSFRVVCSKWVYDAQGNVTETIGRDELRTVFRFDSANPDPCARRNLLQVEKASPMSGIVPSRIVFQAEYDPRFQLPVKTTDEAGGETKFVHDFDVIPFGTTGQLLRIHLPAVVTVDGTPQQSALTFERNARGQVTTALTAEGCRTEFEYMSGSTKDSFLASLARDPGGANLLSTFDYDSAGFPRAVLAPGGRATAFRYNALGQVEEVQAPNIGGSTGTVRKLYDDSGSAARVERTAGACPGMLSGTSILDEFERDELGHLRRAVLAANSAEPREWRYVTDHEGRVVCAWDPSGVRSERVFGEDGVLLSETLAAGESEAETTNYVFDRAGRVKRHTDAWQATIEIQPDVWGRAHRITLASGAVRILEWGVCDRVMEDRVEDVAGSSTRILQRRNYEYDRRGRLTRSIVSSFRDNIAASMPLRTEYLYDKDDRIVEMRLPRGARYLTEFDALGRPATETDPHGNVRRFDYDAAGDLTAVAFIDAPGGPGRTRTATFVYDVRGRLAHTAFLDSAAGFDYDDRNVKVGERVSGVAKEFQVNAHGQVVRSMVDPGGLSQGSSFDFDENGRLLRYTDPANAVTAWERDGLGRAIKVVMPGGAAWTYSTDRATRTTTERMPSGNEAAARRTDLKGRAVRFTSAAAPGHEAVGPREFVLDGLGRVVRSTAGSEVIERQFDSLGRLIEETARGQTVRMEYDDATGSADLVFPDGRRERREFNAAGQPTRVVLITPGPLGGTPGETLLEMFYSASGLPVRLEYGNGVEGLLVHDEHDRLARVEYRVGGAPLDSCRVRYDENGRRAVVQYTGPPAGSRLHDFDLAGRLAQARSISSLAPLPDPSASTNQGADVAAVRAAAAAAPGEAYVLDASDARTGLIGVNGGVTSQTYTLGADHRVIAVGPNSIGYNPDGSRTIDSRFRYDLDSLDRVRRIRNAATNAVVAEMEYDAFSRVAAGTSGGTFFERWFAGAAGIHEASSAGGTRQLSPHPWLPVPFTIVDAAGAAYIHHDDGWSTICVTGAAGVVLERHRNLPFGSPAAFAADGATPLTSFRTEPVWRGMPALDGTGLFRAAQRLYDPELGVFTSRDPLLYADSASPYAFAGHNPVDFADPTGLEKAPLGGQSAATQPPAPDWTAKTEWDFPKPDHRLMQPVSNYDSGNRPLNFLLNKVILPWRNAIAFYGNIPLATLVGVDDALEHSAVQQEYHAAQVMFPMERAMGIAVEAGPAIEYGMSLLTRALRARTAASTVAATRGTIDAVQLGEIATTTSKRRFRTLLTRLISDERHPLHKLLDPATGKLRPSTARGITELDWFENPEVVEAGHYMSAKALNGAPDRLMVMSAYENRLVSAVLEHPTKGGAMIESGRVLVIGGIPIDATTAADLFGKGIIEAQALSEALILRY